MFIYEYNSNEDLYHPDDVGNPCGSSIEESSMPQIIPFASIADTSFLGASDVPQRNSPFSISAETRYNYSGTSRSPVYYEDFEDEPWDENRLELNKEIAIDKASNLYSYLCGILKAVCSNKTNYKKLLSLQSSAAQLILDLLQMTLDHSVTYSLDSTLEHTLLTAMLHLSKRSSLYPRSYILTEVRRDEFRGDYNGRKVALKVFKLYSSEMTRINDLRKAFFKEAILWRHLVHRNLLPFYGICQLGDSGGRTCLVSPWMDNGNIIEYLRKSPDVNRQQLTLDIVRGIAYLHEKSIVHGDLKGVNLSCIPLYVVHVLQILVSIESTVSNAGTIRWLAPELLYETSIGPTKESDIYAFACVCYEVFVGKVPFYQHLFGPTVMRQIMLGQRPLHPELKSDPYTRWGLTDWMWSLIEKCWHEDPSTRPKALEVVNMLSTRKEFLRVDINREDSWGRLRPEVFRSLLDKCSSMSEADIQRSISLLNGL
ncbi:kinase-like domain-containing protein [Cyathus striatus]|nr:kinase-like domain-containing protein [Cyathus striatus]